MAFVECSSKSRNVSGAPLNILECDNETSQGLKDIVATYLGAPNAKRCKRLNRIFHQMIISVVGQRSFSHLVPHVTTNVLVNAVLETIAGDDDVVLETFPDELWSNLDFVVWAAERGMFHEAIPEEVSADYDICYSYYRHGASREKTFPWISDSLKSNPYFVCECVEIDPLAMNHCKSDTVRFNFDVVLAAVRWNEAHQSDDLAVVALENGWSESLVYFAKELRVKVETHYSLAAFLDDHSERLRLDAYLVEKGIAEYVLGTNVSREMSELKRLWNIPTIYSLAVGGSVEEIVMTGKFRRPGRRKRKFGYW